MALHGEAILLGDSSVFSVSMGHRAQKAFHIAPAHPARRRNWGVRQQGGVAQLSADCAWRRRVSPTHPLPDLLSDIVGMVGMVGMVAAREQSRWPRN